MNPASNLTAWEAEERRAKFSSHRVVLDRGAKFDARLGSHAAFLPRGAWFQQ
jgi:hypothetical protein